MKTQHDSNGGLVRCDYNGSYIWRLKWMRNTLKTPKEFRKEKGVTISKILRCGIMGDHKFVRVEKMFYTSLDCIEVNLLRCDNYACPQTKYVVEQWSMSKYPKRFDYRDISKDIHNLKQPNQPNEKGVLK